MPFDLNKARKSGASDDAILDYLSKTRPGFNVQGAIEAGHSKQEVIDYLSNKQNGTKQVSQPGASQPGASQPKTPKGVSFGDRLANLGQKQSQVLNFYKDAAVGQLKGAASSIHNAGKVGADIMGAGYNATIGKLTGQNAIPVNEKPSFLKPTNMAQKIGYGTEQVAEFLVPLGGASKAGGVAKNASKVSKALNLGGRSLLEGADQALRSSVQRGNTEGSGADFAVGAAIPVAGNTLGFLKKQLPKIATNLEKTNLRLTPAQKRDAATKIDDAISFIQENKIIGNPEKRLEKAEELLSSKEPLLQDFLSKASDRKVSRDLLIDELNSIKANYQNERDVLAIEKQVDQAIDTIKKKFPKEIPLARLNELKRSTYKNAYNKAGEKVLDFVEHDIGDIFRKNIEDATEGMTINGVNLSQFNKEYGRAINATKLLKSAASKGQTGLTGKLISSFAGGSLGTALGGPIGATFGAVVSPYIAEALTGTAVRSNAGSIIQGLSKKSLPQISKPLLKAGAAQINK